ncbi:MAG: hypothetical protein IJF16_10600 [Clostridia bacterium]|nr:hypothetical protein [Clostridia bacterium]
MKQKINKAFLQNHFTYQSWIYITLLLIATFGINLLFTVTAYTPPPEKTLIVYFIGDMFSEDEEQIAAQQAMEEVFAQYDQELIAFYGIDMSSMEGQTKYQIVLGAGEGDVLIIDKSYLRLFSGGGYGAPLGQFIENGILNIPEDELLYHEGTDAYGEPVGEQIYGVSTSNMFGLMNDYLYDNRNAMMVVTGYSKNQENAARLVQWLYDRYYDPNVPEYIDFYEDYKEQVKEYNSFNNNNQNITPGSQNGPSGMFGY